MHGDEACRQLRAAGFEVPILAVTGAVEPKDLENYERDGFTGVIPKPFRLKDLPAPLQPFATAKALRLGIEAPGQQAPGAGTTSATQQPGRQGTATARRDSSPHGSAAVAQAAPGTSDAGQSAPELAFADGTGTRASVAVSPPAVPDVAAAGISAAYGAASMPVGAGGGGAHGAGHASLLRGGSAMRSSSAVTPTDEHKRDSDGAGVISPLAATSFTASSRLMLESHDDPSAQRRPLNPEPAVALQPDGPGSRLSSATGTTSTGSRHEWDSDVSPASADDRATFHAGDSAESGDGIGVLPQRASAMDAHHAPGLGVGPYYHSTTPTDRSLRQSGTIDSILSTDLMFSVGGSTFGTPRHVAAPGAGQNGSSSRRGSTGTADNGAAQ